jgi:hypothetical protein
MQTTVQTLHKVLLACQPARATMALGLLLVLGFAQPATAQCAQLNANPLCLSHNYFVTGDYVVGGVGLRGLGVNGMATGNITIPDLTQAQATGMPSPSVPVGADIVAAFLYWETVEKSKSALVGQQGFFNGYPITGVILGNPNAPTSWSSGGCVGSSNGATTLRTYRADVRPYLPVDVDPNSSTFGRLLANGTFPVSLADSGSNGGGAPLTLGATLVIIYRVLSPAAPLNAIVLYDGAFAPSNASSSMIQPIVGFYQAASSPNPPVAKITHIVGDGQPNKSESVLLNGVDVNVPRLYGGLPPFPGIYNGSWDNPTWPVSADVLPNDFSETASVVPGMSNGGCVDWGAVIFSTTVQNKDGDGLLDVWKTNQGYTDAVSGNSVALAGATLGKKDLFVEVDYLSNMDGSAGPYKHSHLPKQDALDNVGKILGLQGIHVHFDLGVDSKGNPIYPGDPFVIPGGTGGNAISEGLLVCNDTHPQTTPLCAYPGQSTIGWKGGFLFTRDSANMPNPPKGVNPALGNFQLGRGQSYHYVLAGHALGASRFFWSTEASALSNPNLNITQLVSIVAPAPGMGPGTAQVTLQSPFNIQSPQAIVKPGDCPPNPTTLPCSDANHDRVTITGAVTQLALNGTYFFQNASSTTSGNVTTTTFTISTANVANGTYIFSNEPQLAVNYLGPTSTSGHSDFGGGGDSAVTFGRWEADDPSGCQGDPSQPGTLCNNQMGTVQVQEGTLLHELGHTFTLTHGGAYYNDQNNRSLATYEPNCKPNFLSVMNYLFQVRGFADEVGLNAYLAFDYSGQPLLPRSEDALDETVGIGAGAAHFTRWYGPPNALDQQLQNTAGGRFATMHCDGTPITDGAQMVRVDGTTLGAPIDWNNNLVIDPIEPVAAQDVNFDGSIETFTNDLPAALQGFDDGSAIDLSQIGARAGAFGFSGGGGGFLTQGGGGFLTQGGGGFLTQGGGGFLTQGGGGFLTQGGGGFLTQGGGGFLTQGGGVEQDSDLANSTADPPTGLACSNCVPFSGTVIEENGKSVPLTWTGTSFPQVRRYDIWRATGSFSSLQCAVTAPPSCAFSIIKTLTGTPPSPTYTDPNVKSNTTYTYFVTEKNKLGVESTASTPPLQVFVKF